MAAHRNNPGIGNKGTQGRCEAMFMEFDNNTKYKHSSFDSTNITNFTCGMGIILIILITLIY